MWRLWGDCLRGFGVQNLQAAASAVVWNMLSILRSDDRGLHNVEAFLLGHPVAPLRLGNSTWRRLHARVEHVRLLRFRGMSSVVVGKSQVSIHSQVTESVARSRSRKQQSAMWPSGNRIVHMSLGLGVDQVTFVSQP